MRGKDIKQCKGKENCHPIRKYAPYCQFFVNQKGLRLCDDMRLLGLISQDGICYDIYDLPKNFVIKGDLVLRGMNLTELPDLSHVVVEGDFVCSYNQLQDLTGSPKWVGGSFDCIHNSLTSLGGAPRKVGGDFNCRFCQMLSSVMGAPTVLDGTFYVDRTDLMQQLHYKNGRLQMGRILVKKENTCE